MINKLKAEGLAYSTVKKAYNLCNNCFKSGVEKRTLPYNPVAGVILPAKDKFKQETKDDDGDVKFYSVAEANMICEAAIRRYGNGKQIYRLGYAIILDLNTGLRDGELRALKWDDVDFDNRILKVRSHYNGPPVKTTHEKNIVNQIIPYQPILSPEPPCYRSAQRNCPAEQGCLDRLGLAGTMAQVRCPQLLNPLRTLAAAAQPARTRLSRSVACDAKQLW